MRVLVISDKLYQGGAEKVCRLTIIYLKKYFNPNIKQYLASAEEPRDDVKPYIEDYVVLEDSKIAKFNFIKYAYNLKNYKILLNFLRKSNPDVIHIHNFYASVSPSLLKAIKDYKMEAGKKIKVVQTLHDFSLLCPNSSFYDYNHKRVCTECINHKHMYPIILNRCYHGSFAVSSMKFVRTSIAINLLNHVELIDELISPSRFLCEFVKLKYPHKECHILRNPLDEDMDSQLSLEEITSIKENNIVYFGRLSYEKGVELLIEAFNRYSLINPNVKLYIIGSGPLEDKLKKLAVKNKAILFTGSLNSLEISNILKTSKVCVFPSVGFENSPLVIIEALLNYCIPIIPKHGGFEEMSRLYGCDFFIEKINDSNKENTINELVNLMDYYMKNYFSYIKKLDECKKKALEEHDNRKYVSRLASVYKGNHEAPIVS